MGVRVNSDAEFDFKIRSRGFSRAGLMPQRPPPLTPPHTPSSVSWALPKLRHSPPPSLVSLLSPALAAVVAASSCIDANAAATIPRTCPGGANCNEHLPPPPPMNCKYCSRKGIATCSEFGMHCNCGDALYNTTGKGMPHGESCSSKTGCTGKCASL